MGGGLPGGDSPVKGAGMLVISFRGVNYGFWYQPYLFHMGVPPGHPRRFYQVVPSPGVLTYLLIFESALPVISTDIVGMF